MLYGWQVVATDVNADRLASLVNEAPDIRAEVMDVKKYEDVEIVIPGVGFGLSRRVRPRPRGCGPLLDWWHPLSSVALHEGP